MKEKKSFFVMVLALTFLSFAGGSFAEVDWEVREAVKMDVPPLDVALSKDGRRIYVLTGSGEILVYAPDGKLQERIGVGRQIDQIEAGPREDLLLIKSSKNKTVDILLLNFVQDIKDYDSPTKGPANAPVTIAVFSDFQ